MARPIRRETCDHCMWLGPVNKNLTMRKHYVTEKIDGHRKQVKALGTCPGSNKPPHVWGCEK